MERRASLELRAKGRRLEGYAALFGVDTRISDFTETILPGAFTDSILEGRDILGLVDHDARRVLARTKSGTLRLAEDTRGLHFDMDVPATSYGNDVLALVESRNAGGASFAFTIRGDRGERWQGDRRELHSVDLHEISIVAAHPAYDGTVVHARARPILAPRLSVARRYLETL
jgi:uncharacterized protein